MAIIDARGESQQIAQNLTQLGGILGELFGDEEQRAMRFAMRNPELAVRLASAGRAAIKAGQSIPNGPDPTIMRGLLKLFPASAEEQRFEFEKAQTTGPQLAALTQLRHATGMSKDLNLPEQTPAQKALRDMMISGATQDQVAAAAPELLKQHKKSMGMRTALLSAQDFMTPLEIKRYENYLQIHEEVGPQAAEPFKPLNELQKLDLWLKNREIDEAKTEDQADLLATPWLVENGYAPSGTALVRGGAKFMRDELSKIKDDARKLTLATATKVQADMDDVALGAAMEFYLSNPGADPQTVSQFLKKNPMFQATPQAKLLERAVAAQAKLRDVYAPRNDAEARRRMGFAGVKLSMPRLLGDNKTEGLIDKGARLGWKGYFATIDEKATAVGGIGLGLIAGRAIGAFSGAGVGSIPASVVGGALGSSVGGVVGHLSAGVVRDIGKALMNEEEQVLWTTAEHIASSVYRTESGAAVRPDEMRKTVDRFIPLWTDKPEVVAFKKEALAQLEHVLANISGMPLEQAVASYDIFGARIDAKLKELGAGSVVEMAPFQEDTAQSAGAGRTWGKTPGRRIFGDKPPYKRAF